MKKLFIHQPIFRLLSPLFTGLIAYIFILLVNNELGQLQSEFINIELIICIGLSYIIQEFSRWMLSVYAFHQNKEKHFYLFLLPLLLTIVCNIAIVSLVIRFYYISQLGYEPNFAELSLFNTIFIMVSVIYFLLYLSHYFMQLSYQKMLRKEMLRKNEVRNQFIAYRQGIHPELLFDSLESLITLSKENNSKADELISHLANVYRYILSNTIEECIPLQQEIEVLDEFIQLFQYLPYRRIEIEKHINSNDLIVKGSLLFILEKIIRSTITSEHVNLHLKIQTIDQFVMLTYQSSDKLDSTVDLQDIDQLTKSYQVYSDRPIQIEINGKNKMISIPLLQLQTTDL